MAMCQENSDSSEFRQAPTCSSMLIASRRDAFSPPGRPLGISHRDVSWYYHFWYYHYPQRDHPHKSWIASQYKDFLRHCFWFLSWSWDVGMFQWTTLPWLPGLEVKKPSKDLRPQERHQGGSSDGGLGLGCSVWVEDPLSTAFWHTIWIIQALVLERDAPFDELVKHLWSQPSADHLWYWRA